MLSTTTRSTVAKSATARFMGQIATNISGSSAQTGPATTTSTSGSGARRFQSHLLKAGGTFHNRNNPRNHLQVYPEQRHQQQVRSVFIQSEETPNPESVKFVPSGITVLPDGDIKGFHVTKSDPMDTILRSPLPRNCSKSKASRPCIWEKPL